MPPSAWRRGNTIPRWSISRGGPALSVSGTSGHTINVPPQAGQVAEATGSLMSAWHWLQIRSMAKGYQVRRPAPSVLKLELLLRCPACRNDEEMS